jgi:SNF2 family DNA or RNA helicase
VICQHWAERKRRVLVICPASLRKQWALELSEKFNLPHQVLDAKIHREAQTAGNPTPFLADEVVICSMHYAGQRAQDIRPVPWDLVVIDEAHKLRNAYRQSNKIGQAIRWAIDGRRKILLTATPLQNSLVELYGLASIIDENIFGDLPSFRTQYCNTGGDITELRSRLKPFCTRTLRRQVLEYIQFTERRLMTRPFKPTDDEHNLYEAISTFLQREDSYAIPHQQKHLITLLVRKVLASSSQAAAGTLEIMRDRLLRLREEVEKSATIVERIIQDEEIDDDLLDELLEDQEDAATEGEPSADEPALAPVTIDRRRLDTEIEELNRYILWARSIGVDTKTRALLKALVIGFGEMTRIGAAQKAVVFTESRRTQQHLKGFLEANGYAGKVLTFNGTNNEPETTEIYLAWVDQNKGQEEPGSRPIDVHR